MSYILDALRKSDQQRHRGAAPKLLSARVTAVAPKPSAYWLYGVVGAVLLAAGIAIGWLRPWQSEPPAIEPIAAQQLQSRLPQTAQPQIAPPQTAPPRLPASAEMAMKPKQETPAQKSNPASPPAPAPARTDRKPHAVATVEPKPGAREVAIAAPREAPKPVSDKAAGTAQGVQEQKLVAMSDLPLSIQQELPNMTISVHAYSGNPKDRLVGINNRMLREGDFLQPGLGLEQITPDGMIFSYKGYRFVRGVR